MVDEQMIRERAYKLWEEDGRPDGHAEDYWERARFLLGLEDNPDAAQLPNPSVPTVQNPSGTARAVEAEPLEAVANLGEFPSYTDQGEKQLTPKVA